jgi:hypothetical protein
MKIDSDLRAAIKAAEKFQPRDSHEKRTERRSKALKAFYAKSPKAGGIRRAAKLFAQASELNAEAYALIKDTGLYHYNSGRSLEINDEDAFEKFSGIPIERPPGEWKAERVISELLATDPKDAAKMFKKYGINWS